MLVQFGPILPHPHRIRLLIPVTDDQNLGLHNRVIFLDLHSLERRDSVIA